MRPAYLTCLLATFVASIAVLQTARAENVTVAVASNFAPTAEVLAAAFEARTNNRVTLLRGSSGKLFAQIVNGAPVDVFLSADSARPTALEARGLVKADSQATYAIGELVVWSRQPQLAGKDCLAAMKGGGRIAIANPLHAPYGVAALAFLQQLDEWPQLESRLVYGENVSQALHFAASGNAHFGVVSRSQAMVDGLPKRSCMAVVDRLAYPAVRQDAVLLRRGGAAAESFMSYLLSDAARDVIARHGYGLPGLAND